MKNKSYRHVGRDSKRCNVYGLQLHNVCAFPIRRIPFLRTPIGLNKFGLALGFMRGVVHVVLSGLRVSGLGLCMV